MPARGERARLGDIIRPSPNRRIIYDLIPNLDVTFAQAPVQTNALGFRGPDPPAVRPGRTVRILGLGDSVMFGWGVRYEECYLARLGERLGRGFPDVRWEVVNTAVPGYNAVMEVETLRVKGLALRPDAVIINFVGNDLGLPNFIREEGSYLSPRRSFFFEWIRSRLAGTAASDGLVPVAAEARRWGREGRPESVPARYRDMVGLPAYRRTMQELGALSAERGFPVVVLAHPEALDFVREIGAELGFLVVETAPAVREYKRTHGIESDRGWPLTITEADPHPSPLGHEIIAGVLFEHLQRSGLAARLAARARKAGGGAGG